MRSLARGLLILSIAVAAPLTLRAIEIEGAPAADAPNTSPQVNEQNGVSFTSGGAGQEEQRVMQRIQDRYNLRVTMATTTGQYTSPSEIRIEDGSGKALVTTKPDGPIFLAKVPPGDYTVRATAEGTTQTHKVSVPASGQAPVTFTWPMHSDPGSQAGDAP